MISGSRKDVRLAWGAILTSALTGAQAVYPYRVGSAMAGQSPVVAVAAAGSARVPWTFEGTLPAYDLSVFIFTAYPKEGDPGTWTEAQTDDAADDLEQELAEAVAGNQKGTYWESVTQVGKTEPSLVVIGGVEYIREVVTLRFE